MPLNFSTSLPKFTEICHRSVQYATYRGSHCPISGIRFDKMEYFSFFNWNMEKSGKIVWIDFAKGYAIFTIVCYHVLQRVALPSALSQAIVFGGTGVHLFFMLSGFGLGLSRHSIAPLVFYKRRLLRVWLPYVIALTLSWGAACLWGLFPNGFQEWLAGVLLYQMFHEPYIESFGGHFWFISTIMQFYLVFPILLWVQKKWEHPTGLVIAALVVSVAWWCAVWALGKTEWRIWNSFFLQFLWEFVLGMVLAQWSRSVEKSGTAQYVFRLLSIQSPLFWIGTGLFFSAVMVGMILKFGAAGKIFNDIPAMLGYTALCIGIYQMGKQWLPPLKNFFLWISSFSYSLYLVHVLVLEGFLLVFTGDIHYSVSWLLGLGFLPLALAGGWAFEHLTRKINI